MSEPRTSAIRATAVLHGDRAYSSVGEGKWVKCALLPPDARVEELASARRPRRVDLPGRRSPAL